MNRLFLIVFFLFVPSITWGQTRKLPPVEEYHFGTNKNLSNALKDAEEKFVHYKDGEWHKVPIVNGIVPRLNHLRRSDGTIHTLRYYYEGGFKASDFTMHDEMPRAKLTPKTKLVPIKRRPPKLKPIDPPAKPIDRSFSVLEKEPPKLEKELLIDPPEMPRTEVKLSPNSGDGLDVKNLGVKKTDYSLPEFRPRPVHSLSEFKPLPRHDFESPIHYRHELKTTIRSKPLIEMPPALKRPVALIKEKNPLKRPSAIQDPDKVIKPSYK